MNSRFLISFWMGGDVFKPLIDLFSRMPSFNLKSRLWQMKLMIENRKRNRCFLDVRKNINKERLAEGIIYNV